MKNKFMWFANDADGLSMVDLLTLLFTLLFIIFKIVHIILIVGSNNIETLTYLSTAISTLDDMMMVIITSYFIKKGIDSTVSKVCLTKEHKYKELYDEMRNDSTSKNKKEIVEEVDSVG